MKKSRRIRLLALALVFAMIGSSVVYTNLDQEGKKSEEQTVLEDNNVAEIEEVVSNEVEETESASNQSVKTKDTVDESAKTEEVVDKPEETKDTVNAPEETKDTVNAPEENKDAADAPEENKDAADAPEETKDTVDTPEENKDTTDKSEENKDTVDNDNQEENKGEEDKITSATEMIVVENAETAVSPKMLRAATYGVKSAETGTIVKYFPVTMYDYDKTTINAATDALDNDTTVREGLYFSNGNVTAEKESGTDLSAFVDGQYYIQNIRAANNNVDSWISIEENNSKYPYKIYGKSKGMATVWNLIHNEDGTYSLSTVVNGKTYYMSVGTNGDSDTIVEKEQTIELKAFSGNAKGVQICQNGYYLCQWNGKAELDYGGYNVLNDGGNGMMFYPVGSETPVVIPKAKIIRGYEEWNRWDKATGNNANGDLFYTGLVRNELIDNEIVFNVNEGGIFDSNSTVKSIYEYVGLPFVFDSTTGYYLFDSDANGVYFAGAPQSGTADNPHNLYFAKEDPQPIPSSVGDGSENIWLPFNAGKSYDPSEVNYHLGMRADLPFSMTANGRIKATDDKSAPITFSFSGDDDVWVFIDGHLVVDLGGIHNRLDVTIDFAANTVTYSENNSADGNTETGSYDDPDFATVQKIFTDDKGNKGLIDIQQGIFAIEDEHVMSVFYLERGEGTSNCKIEFNLPMNDSVLVTKDATQSWSEDGANDSDEGVDPLTTAEQEVVNNIDFGFTLYKKNVEETTFTPVANTNFYLLGRAVEGTVISNTDANGHFYLKNGQTAKFITDISSDGVTYYVVEDALSEAFVTPDYNFKTAAALGVSYYDSTVATAEEITVEKDKEIPEQILSVDAEENRSYAVTLRGSVEANDSVEFICSNYINQKLPNPTADVKEDIIVIDYGLPVQIDPLANDYFRGENIQIIQFGGADATFEETEVDGVKNYSWNPGTEGFKFGKVEFNHATVQNDGTIKRDTFTYTLNKQLTNVEVISYVARVADKQGDEYAHYDYALGKVYIVPATTMYYEENFPDLVTFTGNGWRNDAGELIQFVTEGASAYQEQGVAGTTTDSTYGSDVAYLTDSKDSNGTSYYGDTSNGAIRFAYTFTGTGTSFFARTSAKTGYMQVKLFKGEETTSNYLWNTTYRDTYYNDENGFAEDADGILYNIPVYTESDLPYGTYTVMVTVAKKGTASAGGENGSGNEFYLDGIRVMEPLYQVGPKDSDEIKELINKAHGAYAIDGEANMSMLTLRQKLITDADVEDAGVTPWNFVVFTDTNGEIKTAEEYISIGPKEEVYLRPGQSVSFALKYWELDGFKMYMGMKAPFGIGVVQVGRTTYNLSNTTDCYYDITDKYSSLTEEVGQLKDANGHFLYTDADGRSAYEYVDDESGEYRYKYTDNEELVGEDVELSPLVGTYYVATFTLTAIDKIVSLTNIKITGNYEFAIVEDINIEVGGDENIEDYPENEVDEENTVDETLEEEGIVDENVDANGIEELNEEGSGETGGENL